MAAFMAPFSYSPQYYNFLVVFANLVEAVKARSDACHSHHCIPRAQPLLVALLTLTQDVVMNEQIQAWTSMKHLAFLAFSLPLQVTFSIKDSAEGSLNITSNCAGDCVKIRPVLKQHLPEPYRPNLSRGLARPSSKGQGGNVACVRAERIEL